MFVKLLFLKIDLVINIDNMSIKVSHLIIMVMPHKRNMIY